MRIDQYTIGLNVFTPSRDTVLGIVNGFLANIPGTSLIVAIGGITNPPTFTTANRPTNVSAGMYGIDTTLGIPVYVKSIGPIVWMNAAGVTV